MKTIYTLEYCLSNQDLAIHTKTKEESVILTSYLRRACVKWNSGKEFNCKWNQYQENTCYSPAEGQYGDKACWSLIISFEQFWKDQDQTTLIEREIIKEIYENNSSK